MEVLFFFLGVFLGFIMKPFTPKQFQENVSTGTVRFGTWLWSIRPKICRHQWTRWMRESTFSSYSTRECSLCGKSQRKETWKI